jgi:DNA-binding transcriptional LysR family regulator
VTLHVLLTYGEIVEVHQLEAFVEVAVELHFGRAARKLHMGQPGLSGLIRRLERELGTPLFTRTTRRVALTGAGVELLARSKVILDDLNDAVAAVQAIAAGAAGMVRVGIAPPVAPVLAPHLCRLFAAEAPEVTVTVEPMWLPDLRHAVEDGTIDVLITCGDIPIPVGVVSAVLCAEPLLVGLRPGHRLTGRDHVQLADLAHEMLGRTPEHVFPGWAMCQRQALRAAALDPPSLPLEDTDLSASHWLGQPDVDWIMLIGSLAKTHTGTVIKRVKPVQLVPFTLQWNPRRASTRAVARFVRTALTADPPAGFVTQPGHLRYRGGVFGPANGAARQ